MKSLSEIFGPLIRALNPEPLVGGLEVGVDSVRFVMLEADGSFKQYAMAPLPVGVVSGGVVGDEAALSATLLALRQSVRPSYGVMPVILSLPAPSAYLQAFSMPYAVPEHREEVARLNLKMISPFDGISAYADWEPLPSFGSQGTFGHLEALGAVAEPHTIEPFRAALARAGFMVAGVETVPLSLVRVAGASGVPDDDEASLFIWASTSGITLIVMRRGALYFSKSIAWPGGNDAKAAFTAVAGPEIRKALSFYEGRTGHSVKRVFIAGTGSAFDLTAWVGSAFGIETIPLAGYGGADASWLPVCGAALRGLIPRDEDVMISLGPVGTEDDFVQATVWRFLRLWRTVALGLLSVATFAYLSIDISFMPLENRLSAEVASPSVGSDDSEVVGLTRQAANFNALAEKATVAEKGAVSPVSAFRGIIRSARAGNITLTGLRFSAGDGAIAIEGTATREADIIAFKGVLADNPAIRGVSLPLSAISAPVGGRSAFSATAILNR